MILSQGGKVLPGKYQKVKRIVAYDIAAAQIYFDIQNY